MQEMTIEITPEVIEELEHTIPGITQYAINNCVHLGTAAVVTQTLIDAVKNLKEKMGIEEVTII